MENRFLEKIQTKFVWIFKENIYTITFCQMFLTQTIILQSRILTIKIGVAFLYKNLFFFSRLNRFLFFGVFKCQIIILICGLLLYEGKIIDHLNPTSKMTNILPTYLIENFHKNKIIMIISETWSKTQKRLFYNLIFQHLKTMLKFKNWMKLDWATCNHRLQKWGDLFYHGTIITDRTGQHDLLLLIYH